MQGKIRDYCMEELEMYYHTRPPPKKRSPGLHSHETRKKIKYTIIIQYFCIVIKIFFVTFINFKIESIYSYE